MKHSEGVKWKPDIMVREGGVERVTNKELCVLRSFQQWFPR